MVGNGSMPEEAGMDTWMFLFDRYGVTPQHLEIFNAELATATELPYMVHSEILPMLLAVDL